MTEGQAQRRDFAGIVVAALLAILAAIIAPQVLRYLGTSRSQSAKIQIQNIDTALQLFRLDVGRFPSTGEGLAALVAAPPSVANWNGPYLQKATALNDPWQRPYGYANPGKHGDIDVFSLGSDGAEGGTGDARDVGNWE